MTKMLARPTMPLPCTHLESLEPRLLLSGTTYLVDSLGDDVAADGLVTLREALEAANTNQAVFDAPAGSATAADIITFDPALTAAGAAEIATTAELVIADDVEIRGPGHDLLTLDGGLAHRVLRIEAGVNAVLSSFTIARGYASGSDGGAGLYSAGDAVLEDMAVVDNTGNELGHVVHPRFWPWGAGIYSAEGAALTVAGSTVARNEGYLGAAIYHGGTAPLTILDCDIHDNVAGRTNGGAMIYSVGALVVEGSTIDDADIRSLADATIVQSTLQSQSSWWHQLDVQGNLTITDSTLRGVDAVADGVLTVDHAAFFDNGTAITARGASAILTHSTILGAAVGIENSTTLVVADTLIANSLEQGLINTADATLINTQLAYNGTTRPAPYGGGIANTAETATLTLTQCTVMGNVATVGGGGIHVAAGAVELFNTVVADNTAGGTGADILGPVAATSSHSLVGSGDGMTGIADGVNGNQVGTDTWPIDPRMTLVLTDGVPVLYPRADSPVIDAGDDALAVDAGGTPLATDLAGRPRIAGAAVDIGAIEAPTALASGVEITEVTDPTLDHWQIGHRSTIRWDAVCDPASTVSVYVDTDAVVNGNETWLLTDEPAVNTRGEARWDNLWAPNGTYRIHVAVTDPAAGAVFTDERTVVLDDSDRQVYDIDSLSDEIAFDGVLTLGEALRAANLNTRAGDAPAGSAHAVDVIRLGTHLDGQLLGRPLDIEDPLLIEGPGSALLSIDAGGLPWLGAIRFTEARITGLTVLDPGPLTNEGGLTMVDCVVQGGEGTFLTNTADLNYAVSLTIRDSMLHDRSGLFIDDTGARLTLDTTTFRNGDGVKLMGEAVITNSVFDNAGGIDARYADLTVDGCLFEGNTSDGFGGAVRLSGNATPATIRNSVFVGNHAASRGGAIYGNAWIEQSLFYDNAADQTGGALYLVGPSQIVQSTVYGNSAGVAYGGIDNDEPIAMVNTIVAGNTDAGGVEVGPLTAGSDYNLIGRGVPGAAHSIIGTPDEPAAANLVVDDSGPVVAVRPTALSPAVNAGHAAYATYADGTPITTDLGGEARIVDGAVDLGAYEYPIVFRDPDDDGDIDLDDFAILKAHFGATDATWADGDLTGDSVVDLDDFALLKRRFGTAAAASVDHTDALRADLDATTTLRRRRVRHTQRRQAATLDLLGLTALALG